MGSLLKKFTNYAHHLPNNSYLCIVNKYLLFRDMAKNVNAAYPTSLEHWDHYNCLLDSEHINACIEIIADSDSVNVGIELIVRFLLRHAVRYNSIYRGSGGMGYAGHLFRSR